MNNVVRAWEIAPGTRGPTSCDLGHGLTWIVWFELDSGAYRCAGHFEGTEAQVIADVLFKTGATRAFAMPEIAVGSRPQSKAPATVKSRGMAAGRYP